MAKFEKKKFVFSLFRNLFTKQQFQNEKKSMKLNFDALGFQIQITN